MSETEDYTDLDLYSHEPATRGKQDQMLFLLGGSSSPVQPVSDTLTDIYDAVSGGTSTLVFSSAVVSATAGSTTPIIAAPAAGYAIYVYGYELHAGVSSGTFVLVNGATPLTGVCPVGIYGGVSRDAEHPIYICGNGQALSITTVSCTINGSVCYRVVKL